MTEDKLLEGICECGEKGTIGDICDICGGVFSAGRSNYDDFDDDEDDAYSKDLMSKEGVGDVLPLEEADKDFADNDDDNY